MNLPIQKKPCICTKRLTLRPYAPEDTAQLVALLTHPEVTKTFMVPDFATPEQAVALAERLIAMSRPEDTRHLEYGICLCGRLIGFINDCGIEEDEIEIGYVVHPHKQGHGYATEAVRAVLEELRDIGFRRVTAGYFEGNEASHRVMEKCSSDARSKLPHIKTSPSHAHGMRRGRSVCYAVWSGHAGLSCSASVFTLHEPNPSQSQAALRQRFLGLFWGCRPKACNYCSQTG